eukprot:13350954-Alexandrium_andersonii.AAC.1
METEAAWGIVLWTSTLGHNDPKQLPALDPWPQTTSWDCSHRVCGCEDLHDGRRCRRCSDCVGDRARLDNAIWD